MHIDTCQYISLYINYYIYIWWISPAFFDLFGYFSDHKFLTAFVPFRSEYSRRRLFRFLPRVRLPSSRVGIVRCRANFGKQTVQSRPAQGSEWVHHGTVAIRRTDDILRFGVVCLVFLVFGRTAKFVYAVDSGDRKKGKVVWDLILFVPRTRRTFAWPASWTSNRHRPFDWEFCHLCEPPRGAFGRRLRNANRNFHAKTTSLLFCLQISNLHLKHILSSSLHANILTYLLPPPFPCSPLDHPKIRLFILLSAFSILWSTICHHFVSHHPHTHTHIAMLQLFDFVYLFTTTIFINPNHQRISPWWIKKTFGLSFFSSRSNKMLVSLSRKRNWLKVPEKVANQRRSKQVNERFRFSFHAFWSADSWNSLCENLAPEIVRLQRRTLKSFFRSPARPSDPDLNVKRPPTECTHTHTVAHLLS